MNILPTYLGNISQANEVFNLTYNETVASGVIGSAYFLEHNNTVVATYSG